MTRKERYQNVIEYFKKNMPIAETELNHGNPYELVVATILSAQCTDKRVNIITPHFFERYPTVEALAVASQEAVFEIIKSCSYPNNKAKNLIGMAKGVMENFGGEIPADLKALQTLPGIGRKTANVVASVAFKIPAMAVDTHVFRVARRIGLSQNAKTPLETEKQLMQFIPKDLWNIAHHWLILHGRYTCLARKPKCSQCGIRDYCKEYPRFQKKELLAAQKTKS
ncbi:MAG: endonuclease III [Tenuifilaceae bacterium]|nr:endonuclease III [Bacteroidales bacterium]MDI9517154.1 endonuclease III [Bacteroidota bacterium]NLH55343.1 endonuclease III [Rikenellaceae bacterium]OQC65140.1 MAG: Endonuclease III [Bacteroidetes bacterium ADurb.Bin008]HNV80627.1 endonuclease III [Tenuifilaceae bacterium]